MTDIFTPAVHTRKKKIIVFDTETTGLLPYDRIITLGAVKIEGDELLTQSLYLIFDPRKDSSPQAEAVHGFDNWMTRYQDYLPIWQVHCGNGSAGQTSWWLTTLNLICVIFNGIPQSRSSDAQPAGLLHNGWRQTALERRIRQAGPLCFQNRFIACGSSPWGSGRCLFDGRPLFASTGIKIVDTANQCLAGAKQP